MNRAQKRQTAPQTAGNVAPAPAGADDAPTPAEGVALSETGLDAAAEVVVGVDWAATETQAEGNAPASWCRVAAEAQEGVAAEAQEGVGPSGRAASGRVRVRLREESPLPWFVDPATHLVIRREAEVVEARRVGPASRCRPDIVITEV